MLRVRNVNAFGRDFTDLPNAQDFVRLEAMVADVNEVAQCFTLRGLELGRYRVVWFVDVRLPFVRGGTIGAPPELQCDEAVIRKSRAQFKRQVIE